MAAEVGHLQLAYDYLAEAAFMDLQDREHNTKDGLHIASLAGAWTALVGGFGGMRADASGLSFSPKLPPGLARLSFRLTRKPRDPSSQPTSGSRFEIVFDTQKKREHRKCPRSKSRHDRTVYLSRSLTRSLPRLPSRCNS